MQFGRDRMWSIRTYFDSPFTESVGVTVGSRPNVHTEGRTYRGHESRAWYESERAQPCRRLRSWNMLRNKVPWPILPVHGCAWLAFLSIEYPSGETIQKTSRNFVPQSIILVKNAERMKSLIILLTEPQMKISCHKHPRTL